MYEVTLGTNGIQQLGWATIACRFTNEVSAFGYFEVIAILIKAHRRVSEMHLTRLLMTVDV